MKVFDSVAKKLAIPVVVLFEIGWIVCTGGFGSQLRLIVEYGLESEDARESAGKMLRSPTLFPEYFTLVGGQFVAVLFLVHAALPSGIASRIVGVVSTILNIIYFVSVGYLINWTAVYVRRIEVSIREQHTSPSAREQRYLDTLRCVLAGTIMMAVSWGLIQLLFFFYETSNSQRRSLWEVIREFGLPIPSTSQIKKATPGDLLRLCTIPVMILSAIGWCVCVGGLHIHLENGSISCTGDYNLTSFPQQYDFGIWATFFIAPLLYLAALLFAGCSSDASTMSGIFAVILNTFFVLNVGYTVMGVSINKYSFSQLPPSGFARNLSPQEIYNGNLTLGGGIACLIFWTFVCVFWYFYHLKGSRDPTSLQPNSSDNHPQIIFHAQQNEYNSSFAPEQPPAHAKHLEPEMQPVN